jgi:hypothetical protein
MFQENMAGYFSSHRFVFRSYGCTMTVNVDIIELEQYQTWFISRIGFYEDGGNTE